MRRRALALVAMLGGASLFGAPPAAEVAPSPSFGRPAVVVEASPGAPRLRAVTYNLRSGLGPGFALRVPVEHVKRNLEAIAEAIAAAPRPGEPAVDVVALNEVDFGSRRSGWIDQARFLAAALERRTGEAFGVVRGQTWRRRVPGREVRFGNAALVRHPILESFSCPLLSAEPCADGALSPMRPHPVYRALAEPRGALRVTFRSPMGPIDAVVTHLDPFMRRLRQTQAARVLEGFVDPHHTTLLLGDMNAVAPAGPAGADRTHAILTGTALRDARLLHPAAATAGPWPTFPASRPRRAIDWVLATPDLVPEHVEVIGDEASDHRGLFVRYVKAPS